MKRGGVRQGAMRPIVMPSARIGLSKKRRRMKGAQ
jgi:hypothetical protein